MMLVAAALLYLAIKKDVERLCSYGFGCFLVNMPLSDVMDPGSAEVPLRHRHHGDLLC
jgi:Na+-transporting methylmalonyl-CoA/oxaloacetate decarboxylase beta subunit